MQIYGKFSYFVFTNASKTFLYDTSDSLFVTYFITYVTFYDIKHKTSILDACREMYFGLCFGGFVRTANQYEH